MISKSQYTFLKKCILFENHINVLKNFFNKRKKTKERCEVFLKVQQLNNVEKKA